MKAVFELAGRYTVHKRFTHSVHLEGMPEQMELYKPAMLIGKTIYIPSEGGQPAVRFTVRHAEFDDYNRELLLINRAEFYHHHYNLVLQAGILQDRGWQEEEVKIMGPSAGFPKEMSDLPHFDFKGKSDQSGEKKYNKGEKTMNEPAIVPEEKEVITPEVLGPEEEIPQKEIEDIIAQVSINVDKVLDDPQAMAEIYNINVAGLSDMNILNHKIKDIIGANRADDIADSIGKMRSAISTLNGSNLKKKGLKQFIMSLVPFVKEDALTSMAVRYEKAEEVVSNIVKTLQGGLMEIQQDNKELARLGRHIKSTQEDTQRSIVMLETAREKLDNMEAPEDEEKLASLNNLKETLLLKLQDAKVAMHSNRQFLITIIHTMHSNRMLCESVVRTSNSTFTIAASGLALRSALARQQKLMLANVAAKEFTNELIKDNAEAFRTQSKEIANSRVKSTVDPAALEEGYIKINAAIEDLSAAASKSVEMANENLKRLDALKTKLALPADVRPRLVETTEE